MRSQSEDDGIAALAPSDIDILSVGISTGGMAELRMLSLLPARRIIATTLDEAGADAVRVLIKERGLSDRITVRLEDIASHNQSYKPASFDFVYARLVLHYLSAHELEIALSNIHKLLRQGGRLFVVVRSINCEEAQQTDNSYDPGTKLTTYTVAAGDRQATRYFHSRQSISGVLHKSGFRVLTVQEFDENLSPSFNRNSGIWVKNNVIELLAERLNDE